MTAPAPTRIALALIVLAAGCARVPSSPDAPGAPAGAPGAIIEGRVTTAVAGALTGMTVRVTGTPLSTGVTDQGTFRLTSVPAGQVRLQFNSAVVNAAADLANVAATEVIQVQVQVSGASAVVVSQTRANDVSLCHATGNGSYHMIAVAPEAETAHRAHGDGMPGEPVPGRSPLVFGEACDLLGPAVAIEKSTNDADADQAPGPSIPVGTPIAWVYEVSNTGTVELTGIVVDDDQGVAVSCGGQTSLAPGASMTCTGNGVATLGPYRNVGRVTADWTMSLPSGPASGTISDTDASHYLGVSPTVEGIKVTLCHKTGTPRYVEITVDVDAEPAHRAHGDAKIGEAVPGQAGKVFGTGCIVQ